MITLPGTHEEPESGFTLTEVLVALAIFTVLGLAMLELSSTVYYRDAVHRDTLAATRLAQSKVEELLQAEYDDPRLLDPDGGSDVGAEAAAAPEFFHNPDHADPNNPLDAEGGITGPRKFALVWNVGTDIPAPGLKTVTVLVGWRDSRGNLQVIQQSIQVARLK